MVPLDVGATLLVAACLLVHETDPRLEHRRPPWLPGEEGGALGFQTGDRDLRVMAVVVADETVGLLAEVAGRVSR